MSIGPQNDNVLSEYTMDNLGTSFKVVLVDSVKKIYRADTKKFEIVIPSFQSLIKQIALTRASEPAKLRGDDIRFLRKTLGYKSKELAEKLDITPEHLSRCEAGDRVLSPNSEKILRTLVLLEPVFILEQAAILLDEDEDNKIGKEKVQRLREMVGVAIEKASQLKLIISDMKINPIANSSVQLVLRFQLCPKEQADLLDGVDESGKWKDAA